ncbi:MAG: hypothetical protein ACRDL7_00070 [Gaiellaceae bacterium]
MLSVFPQASGEAGVRQTLSKMAGLVRASKLDPAIRDQAALAISGCEKGNKICHCAALLSWTNRKIRYVADPQGVELLHDPRLIARAIAGKKLVYGDCDDMSVYLAALLASVGLAPILRAVGYNGANLSHVYVVCCGLNLDPTRDAWNVSYRPHVETWVVEERV